MIEIKKWYYRKIADETVKNLGKNGFTAKYFDSRNEALAYIEEIIDKFSSIGFGGSMTVLEELKLQEIALKKNKEILNHNSPELSLQEKNEIRRKQQTCDLFITSTNALTRDGKLINIDGVGNRVSAMIFGPKKVLIVAGINKITKDIHDGIKRVREISAPMNAKRLNKKTPCVETGKCVDCNSPERICRVLTILEKKPALTDIEIIIIGENLGF